MTDKILIYHRIFIGCCCLMSIFFLISITIFMRFKIYKRINSQIENKGKRNGWKQQKKKTKEENNEQTIHLSNVETVELAKYHDLCSKCYID